MANIVRANNEWIALVCYKLEKNTAFRESYPDLEMRNIIQGKNLCFPKALQIPK